MNTSQCHFHFSTETECDLSIEVTPWDKTSFTIHFWGTTIRLLYKAGLWVGWIRQVSLYYSKHLVVIEVQYIKQLTQCHTKVKLVKEGGIHKILTQFRISEMPGALSPVNLNTGEHRLEFEIGTL